MHSLQPQRYNPSTYRWRTCTHVHFSKIVWTQLVHCCTIKYYSKLLVFPSTKRFATFPSPARDRQGPGLVWGLQKEEDQVINLTLGYSCGSEIKWNSNTRTSVLSHYIRSYSGIWKLPDFANNIRIFCCPIILEFQQSLLEAQVICIICMFFKSRTSLYTRNKSPSS